MATNGFQGKEICEIIKTCAKAGVSELSLGDMSIKFGTEESKIGISSPVEGIQPILESPGKVQDTPQENYQIDVLQERALEELEAAQTLIDDPMAFEQEIIDGYIKGDVDETNDSRRTRENL